MFCLHMCIFSTVYMYSSKQGVEMAEVADICFSMGKFKWKKEEWIALYASAKQREPACFTVAGVIITRENAFQVGAALISTLLVFAELANGNKFQDCQAKATDICGNQVLITGTQHSYNCNCAFGPETTGLLNVLGKMIQQQSGEPRALEFLRQRISIEIQRGNAASIMGQHHRRRI
ncbi:uncharacterized protein LOC129600343 [Paramacrobiotus metropolitanus]|uniref:uncharacterized protein LOC129600343 n=1 Tax=Paramacrobiotus metropolitanus TaxID=2943436 RepID=UPI0024461F80|nr:uncharacterized protein LOC129600343 [Paramacrobiotus metropolitanus]